MRNNELQAKILRLQKENEELKNKIESYNCNANCYKYKEANKYKQALEEIRSLAKPIKENTCFGMYCGFVDWILETINEVLNG